MGERTNQSEAGVQSRRTPRSIRDVTEASFQLDAGKVSKVVLMAEDQKVVDEWRRVYQSMYGS